MHPETPARLKAAATSGLAAEVDIASVSRYGAARKLYQLRVATVPVLLRRSAVNDHCEIFRPGILVPPSASFSAQIRTAMGQRRSAPRDYIRYGRVRSVLAAAAALRLRQRPGLLETDRRLARDFSPPINEIRSCDRANTRDNRKGKNPPKTTGSQFSGHDEMSPEAVSAWRN